MQVRIFVFGVLISSLVLTKCASEEEDGSSSGTPDLWSTDLVNMIKGEVHGISSSNKTDKAIGYFIHINPELKAKNNIPVWDDSKCPKCAECPRSRKRCTKYEIRKNTKPMDCGEILRNGASTGSGVYTIWPKSRMFTNRSLQVYCDMETDGGGWTVIQRRGNFSTPKDYFYKTWNEYVGGFGKLKEEFWLGLDNIFAISNQAQYGVRFDIKHADGEPGYAKYETFRISDEYGAYQLDIGNYSGNVGDAMWRYSWKFSTKDRDNDAKENIFCAKERKGAWWYKGCTFANLNGLYQPGVDSQKSMYWYNWKKNYVGLSWVVMKLRSNYSD